MRSLSKDIIVIVSVVFIIYGIGYFYLSIDSAILESMMATDSTLNVANNIIALAISSSNFKDGTVVIYNIPLIYALVNLVLVIILLNQETGKQMQTVMYIMLFTAVLFSVIAVWYTTSGAAIEHVGTNATQIVNQSTSINLTIDNAFETKHIKIVNYASLMALMMVVSIPGAIRENDKYNMIAYADGMQSN